MTACTISIYFSHKSAVLSDDIDILKLYTLRADSLD